MNWIETKKTSPPKGEAVLGALNYNKYCICYLESDGKTWVEDSTGQPLGKWITHWISLPKLPL